TAVITGEGLVTLVIEVRVLLLASESNVFDVTEPEIVSEDPFAQEHSTVMVRASDSVLDAARDAFVQSTRPEPPIAGVEAQFHPAGVVKLTNFAMPVGTKV